MPKVIQINVNRLGKTEVGCEVYTINAEDNHEGFDKTLTDIIEIYMINIDFYKERVYNGNKKFIEDN